MEKLWCVNSFIPGTHVLMADGTSKPIEEIQIGDWVLAADPTTGEQGARQVTDLIYGEGLKALVDIEIDGNTITATDLHPFWVVQQNAWVDAADLTPGDLVLGDDGMTLLVDNVRVYTVASQVVHNLTVDDLHTYYVFAGAESVLVHNCNARLGQLRAKYGNPAARSLAGEADVFGRLAKSKAARGADISFGISKNGQLRRFSDDVDAKLWEDWKPRDFGVDDIDGWDPTDISNRGAKFMQAFDLAVDNARNIRVNMRGIDMDRVVRDGLIFAPEKITSWEIMTLLQRRSAHSKLRFHNVPGASGTLNYDEFLRNISGQLTQTNSKRLSAILELIE